MGAAELIALLLERGQTAATAESCTGGLLGKLLLCQVFFIPLAAYDCTYVL